MDLGFIAFAAAEAAETAHETDVHSNTPFYVLGLAAAGWAVVLSALGLTQPDFPRNAGGQRVVMAISVVLVAAAIGAAITTAG